MFFIIIKIANDIDQPVLSDDADDLDASNHGAIETAEGKIDRVILNSTCLSDSSNVKNNSFTKKTNKLYSPVLKIQIQTTSTIMVC